ncbi:putative glutamate synthase [Fusarium oxysporum f. sp. albedinis]|nr:putative glutamate synthase [Fusarium oxysporum f. sp. albedinis]
MVDCSGTPANQAPYSARPTSSASLSAEPLISSTISRLFLLHACHHCFIPFDSLEADLCPRGLGSCGDYALNRDE